VTETQVRPQRRSSLFLWAIWVIAAVIVEIVVAAVWRHESATSSSNTSMSSMSMGSDLIRLRSSAPLGPLLGSRLITVWQLDAVAVLALALLAASYLTALILAGRRNPDVSWPIGRTVSFMAGVAVCGWATNGSVSVYDMALFSAHMIGHLAFVMVVPALLMNGRPFELALLASRPGGQQRLSNALQGRVVSVITAPPVAFACYATVIVGSHLTGLMNVIMRSEWAGQVEHLVYVLVGCQFFALVHGDTPIRWQLSSPVRWIMLALAMAVDTFTGLILMQSTVAVDMEPLRGLSVNTLADTHTGGAIMWFGGDGIMAVVMISLVIGWLRDPQRQRRDNASWLEQARRATFLERTGSVGTQGQGAVDDLDFDSEDARLADYNSWLESLNKR
jgi:cytochrome c oxidase assembly factor CtaG